MKSGTPFKSSISFIIIPLIILITAGSILAALEWHWHLAMQYIMLGKILMWCMMVLYAVLPVLISGHWLSRKLFPVLLGESFTWSLIISWLTGWGMIILIGIILLASNMYSEIVWIAFAGTLNLVMIVWLFVYRWKPLVSFWNIFRTEIVNDLFGEGLMGSNLWNCLILLLLILTFLRAMLPPSGHDELMYHLVLPRLWDLQHNWWVSTDNYHLLFPSNIEIIWGYSMTVGGLHAPALVTWFSGLLVIAFMRRWQKEAGFSPWIAGFSILFFLASPMTLVTMAMSYVEWPVMLFVFIGWWASGKYVATGKRSFMLMAAIAWGLSLGTKYNFIPVIGLLALERLFLIFRRLRIRECMYALCLLIITAAIFFIPWLYRNHALTSNPFFPLKIPYLSSIQQTVTHSDQEIYHLVSYENIQGLPRWVPLFYHACLDPTSDNRLHLGWPLLHAFVLLFGIFWAKEKPWVSIAVLTVIFFYFTPAARIYFPLMGLTWFFLPDFLQKITERKAMKALVAGTFIVILISSLPMSFHASFMSYEQEGLKYIIGINNDELFLKKIHRITPVFEWVRNNTPIGTRIWAWGESDIFYLERWCRPSPPYDYPVFLTILEHEGAQGLTREIKKDDIDLILVNTSAISLNEKKVKSLKESWTIPDELHASLLSWMNQNLTLLIKDSYHELYQVKR